MPKNRFTRLQRTTRFSSPPLAASSPPISIRNSEPKEEVQIAMEVIERYVQTKLSRCRTMRDEALFEIGKDVGNMIYSHEDDEEAYDSVLENAKRGIYKHSNITKSIGATKQYEPPSSSTSKRRLTRSRSNEPKQNTIPNRTYRRSKSKEDTFLRTPSVLQTPFSRGRSYQVASVTRGSSTSRPLVFRKPCVGEQVISMSGSPILVPAEGSSATPQMHIPLPDGRVFAVMPQGQFDDLPDFPDVDSETREKLRVLYKFLNEKIFREQ